jgi:proteasome assembly chaperone (PAC2) family protein
VTALYELLEQPDLESPVVVLALDGWVDAGLGMQAARAALLESLDTVTVATFDADELLDHRARRPVMHLADGILAGLTWPSVELRAATDADGNDLLLLVGSEPDHRWRAFSGAAVDLAMQFGARLVVGFGAYPAPVPHTRPTRLACSASDAHLAQFCSVHTTVDVPGGVHAAIERRAAEVGLPAIGLWAQVPHYASAMPSPAAAAALLDGLAQIGSLSIDTDDLHAEAAANRERIDELINANPEHAELVRRLEQAWDAELSDVGSDLASEIERFLRDQGG